MRAKNLKPQPDSYEAALAELEQLLTQLESGNTPLEELLAAYQRGAALLEFCKEKLAVVENQVRVLDGQPTVSSPAQEENDYDDEVPF